MRFHSPASLATLERIYDVAGFWTIERVAGF
jgi:hypothetical protein